MKLTCLSEEIVLALDEALERARLRVESEEVDRTQVTLQFTLERNEENELAGSFKLTGTEGRKGAWMPGASAQLRLLDGVEVTLGRGDQKATAAR